MGKFVLCAFAVFATVLPSQAQADRYAAISDILTAARCEVARLHKNLVDNGFKVTKFTGTVDVKSERATSRNAAVEASAIVAGFMKISGNGGYSRVFKGAVEETYVLSLIPNISIPRLCDKDRLWIRTVDEKNRPRKALRWNLEFPDMPANQKYTDTHPRPNNINYTASLDLTKNGGAGFSLNLLIFKIEPTVSVTDTTSKNFSFDYEFGPVANPNISGGSKLPSDKIPVGFK